jgi:hypothetical protein
MQQTKSNFKWLDSIQKWLLALLGINALFLALVLATPYLNFNSPFVRETRLLLDTALPVQQQSGLLFGNLQLETEGNLSLAAAKLYINGILAGNFGSGSLLTRVYEGDILVLDAAAYQRQLTFFLTTVSTNIDTSELSAQIITDGNAGEMPEISFR